MHKLGKLIIAWRDGTKFIGRILTINFLTEEYIIVDKDDNNITISFYDYIEDFTE